MKPLFATGIAVIVVASLAGRGESRTRPARHGVIGHRGTETQRKPNDSLCLGVSVAHFSVSRSPWDDFCHGLLGAQTRAPQKRPPQPRRPPTETQIIVRDQSG